jgi:hypothetical protein
MVSNIACTLLRRIEISPGIGNVIAELKRTLIPWRGMYSGVDARFCTPFDLSLLASICQLKRRFA